MVLLLGVAGAGVLAYKVRNAAAQAQHFPPGDAVAEFALLAVDGEHGHIY